MDMDMETRSSAGAPWGWWQAARFFEKTSSPGGMCPAVALASVGTRKTWSLVFVPPQSPDITSLLPWRVCAGTRCCSYSTAAVAVAAAAAAVYGAADARRRNARRDSMFVVTYAFVATDVATST